MNQMVGWINNSDGWLGGRALDLEDLCDVVVVNQGRRRLGFGQLLPASCLMVERTVELRLW